MNELQHAQNTQPHRSTIDLLCELIPTAAHSKRAIERGERVTLTSESAHPQTHRLQTNAINPHYDHVPR